MITISSETPAEGNLPMQTLYPVSSYTKSMEIKEILTTRNMLISLKGDTDESGDLQ